MRKVIGLTLLLAALLAPAAHAASGDLTQLADPFGCHTLGPGNGCSDTTALDQPNDVAVSADGQSVYAAVNLSESVVHWQRDAATGGLTQPSDPTGCWSETGAGPCGDGKGLYFASGVAVSPDGKNVYISANDGVAVLDRDTATGLLTQRTTGTEGCYTNDGDSIDEPNVCEEVPTLGEFSEEVAVSPDGEAVYVAGDNAVNAFTRSSTNGDLTFVGCHNTGGTGGCATGRHLGDTRGLTISPDGETVYVASVQDDTLEVFDRNTDTNTLGQKDGAAGCIAPSADTPADCAPARAMTTSFATAVSADGQDLYLATRSLAVLAFDRDGDGALTQKPGAAGCLSESTTTQTTDTCAPIHDVPALTGIAVSPDGADVYASSQDTGGIALFKRDADTGVLTQAARPGGCIASASFWITNKYCQTGKAMGETWGLALSPGGSNLYVVAHNDAVASFARDGGADPTPSPSPTPSPVPPGQTATPSPSPSPTATPPVRLPKTYPPPRIRTVNVNIRNGNVTVTSDAPDAGTVTVSADGTITIRSALIAKRKKLKIARAKKTVAAAGPVKLTLKPKGKAKKILRRKGKLKATLKIAFTPATGTAPAPTKKKVTFRFKR